MFQTTNQSQCSQCLFLNPNFWFHTVSSACCLRFLGRCLEAQQRPTAGSMSWGMIRRWIWICLILDDIGICLDIPQQHIWICLDSPASMVCIGFSSQEWGFPSLINASLFCGGSSWGFPTRITPKASTLASFTRHS